jgi:GH15 family glucan-1,4-alpha-glucosidase
VNDLKHISIDLILKNQSSSGSYIASPDFPAYRYSWLRDGSFIAYSMLIHGETDSCQKFLNWVHTTILLYKSKVGKIAFKLANNKVLYPEDFLYARYTLDGMEVRDNWPNFQIDGYGTWLWCLAEYCKLTGDDNLVVKFQESIRTTIDYLKMVWKIPNYDCWEENGNQVHPSTLACVYGGIEGINRFFKEKELSDLSHDIRKFILSNLTEDGMFPKYIGSDSVDSSLLWLSVPFKVVEPDHPAMKKTVQAIEGKLLEKGGVKRYPEDTFYGGGQWILLTCWLAWYYLKIGKIQKAEQLYEWTVLQSDERGYLSEQVQTDTNDSKTMRKWEKRWGKVAKPLLWSHSMFLVLVRELENL